MSVKTASGEVKIRNKIKSPKEDYVFYTIVTIIMILFIAVCLIPMMHVIAASFSSGLAVASGKVALWPVDFSVESYIYVFNYNNVVNSFFNSIIYTAVGTCVKIIFCMVLAYPMARANKIPGWGIIIIYVLIPNYFGPSMVPQYINISNLGMIDTMWAIIMPSALPIGSAIITRTFLTNGINGELQDAADIDGCSDIQFFFQMVLPLSKVIIATNMMMYVSDYWNSYFSAMIYIRDDAKYPLQLVLRNLLANAGRVDLTQINNAEEAAGKVGLAELLKYAFCVIATLPMVVVYPFVQKYLVQGTMAGAVKG